METKNNYDTENNDSKLEITNLYKMLSKHCYKKYKNIVEKNNVRGYYSITFITISKIQNIRVSSTLKIPLSKICSHMIFEINDKLPPYKNLFVYTCSFEKVNNEFIELQIFDMLNLIIEVVHNLKFDKLTGKFREYIEPFGNEFIDGDQCCVCYDFTMTKTIECNHYICRYCYQQLKNKYTCPICRTKSQLDSDSECDCFDQDDDDDENVENDN